MGKKPKDRRGTAQDEHFVLIFAFPPVPRYGGSVPVGFCKIIGAQNQECLPAFPFGPTGALSGQKFAAGAVQELRLALPSQLAGIETRRRRKVNCPAGARSRPQAHFEANRRKAAALRPRGSWPGPRLGAPPRSAVGAGALTRPPFWGTHPGGRPKGLPYPSLKCVLKIRRGGACPSRHFSG